MAKKKNTFGDWFDNYQKTKETSGAYSSEKSSSNSSSFGSWFNDYYQNSADQRAQNRVRYEERQQAASRWSPRVQEVVQNAVTESKRSNYNSWLESLQKVADARNAVRNATSTQGQADYVRKILNGREQGYQQSSQLAQFINQGGDLSGLTNEERDTINKKLDFWQNSRKVRDAELDQQQKGDAYRIALMNGADPSSFTEEQKQGAQITSSRNEIGAAYDASTLSRRTAEVENILKDNAKTQKYLVEYSKDANRLNDNRYYEQFGEMNEAATIDEMVTYGYLKETEGKESAQKYWNAVRAEIVNRLARQKIDRTQETIQNVERAILPSEMWNTGDKIAQGLGNLGTQLEANAQTILGNTAAPITMIGGGAPKQYTTEMLQAANAIKNQNTQEVAGDNKLARILWSGASSGIENVAQAAMGGALADVLGYTGTTQFGITDMANLERRGQMVGDFISIGMSSGAVLTGIEEGKAKGYSDDEAIIRGLVSGAIEYATEKIGADWMFQATAMGRAGFKRLLKAGLAEGTEELMGNNLDRLADAVIDAVTKKKVTTNDQNVRKYISQGMSEAEAQKQVTLDNLDEDIEAFASAFFSAAMSSGGYASLYDNGGRQLDKVVRDITSDNESRQAMVESGLESDVTTEAYKLATEIQRKLDAGENVSLEEYEDLYLANTRAERGEADTIAARANMDTRTAAESIRDTIEEEREGTPYNVLASNVIEEAPTEEPTTTKYGKMGNEVYTSAIQEIESRGTVPGEARHKFESIYNAGFNNTSMPEVTGLSNETKRAVWEAGFKDQVAYVEEMTRKGWVSSTNIGVQKTADLAAAMQANQIDDKLIKNLNTFAEKYLGVGVNILATNKLANGTYEHDTGNINLYMDSIFLNKIKKGSSVAEAVYATFGHEMTHRLQELNPKMYSQMQSVVMQAMGTNTFAQRVAHMMRLDDRLTQAQAQDEVVADFIGQNFFADQAFTDKFLYGIQNDTNTTAQEKRSMLTRIRDFVRKIRDFFRNEAKDDPKVSLAEKNLARVEEALTKLLGSAEESIAERAVKDTPETLQKMDLALDTETQSVFPSDGMRLSQKTWNESDYVIQREVAAADMAKALDITLDKAKAYIDTVNGIAKYIADNATRLDYVNSNYGSSFVSNVEYGGSFDFTTMCQKARLFMGTFTEVQKRLGKNALTANEVLELRKLMKDKNYQVTCGCCYVEGSRASEGQFALKFMELYQAYYPDNWQPDNLAYLDTPDGIEWTRINHPECYEQYMKFWNDHGRLREGDPNLFASQQKPKMYQSRTAYNGEIMTHFADKADTIDKKNKNGGIRMQSFSDFEIVHLIDSMQVIMDMARVGLAGQAYTKVYNFADAFGNTGLKINLSLIAKGVDENGNIMIDPVEGMKEEEARELRDKYSDNVGTIIVCFNDDEVLAAMKSDFIDFIIPFHRSQWKKSQYALLGLPSKVKDYTYQQNEKLITQTYHEYQGRMVKDKATNYMPNMYWDFSMSGKENAEKYLRLCAENNKRPKFYKFLDKNFDGSYSLKKDGSTDGYWKLLIDFKMYNNEGVGVPQQPVRPDFSMPEINTMLADYTGGHNSFPVANDVVDKFTEEYKKAHGIRESRKDSDADYMSAVNSNDMETAQRMVNEAAEEAGYDSEDLYHGTQAFGFTEFDLNKMDDKISIFTTNDQYVAQSYVGDRAKVRTIADAFQGDVNNMNADELADAYNKNFKEKIYVVGNQEREDLMLEIKDDLRGAANIISEIKQNEPYAYNETTGAEIDRVADALNSMASASDLDEFVDAYNEFYTARGRVYDRGGIIADQIMDSGVGSTALAAMDQMPALIGNSKSLFGFENYRGTNIGQYITETQIREAIRGLSGGIYKMRGKTSNMLTIEGRGSNWSNVDIDDIADDFDDWWINEKGNEPSSNGQHTPANTRMLSEYAKEKGYDGVIIYDVYDSGGFTWYEDPSDLYVYFDSSSLKSTDPVTYDDNGNVIPLSERFNESKTDIRYSMKDSAGNEISEAQAKYFANSVARDDSGNLLLMYHGTPDNSWNVFNSEYGQSRRASVGNWFTPNENVAAEYAEDTGQGTTPGIKQGYINIENPLEIDANGAKWYEIPLPNELQNKGISRNRMYIPGKEATFGPSEYTTADSESLLRYAKANGYDGLIIRNVVDGLSDAINNGTRSDIYATLRSNQFKNADNLAPTENSDIRYSVKGSAEAVELSDANTKYSIRQEEPPKKTGIAYKVFLAKDGQLYPPMVANPGGEGTPVGVWLNADEAPMAGFSKTGRPQVAAGGKGTNVSKQTLAYRPGWHLGDVPLAKQFAKLNPETGVKDLFPANFVWAECEYAMDVDYQNEADDMGYMRTNSDGTYYRTDKYQHSLAGLKKLPKDGYYHYRTNPNPDTVPWVITGAMRVTKILNDDEVAEICRANGVEPMQRQGGPIDLAKYGLDNAQQQTDIRYSMKDSDDIVTDGTRALIKDSRLDELIKDSSMGKDGQRARDWITAINPTDFINLTTGKTQDRNVFDRVPGEYGTNVDEYDFIEGLQKSRQTPYLAVDISTGEVRGHEGRHRMRALERAGITSAAIRMEFRDSTGHTITSNASSVFDPEWDSPLEIKRNITLINQMGTGQTVTLDEIVPLNESNRDYIYSKYSEFAAGENDIRYSLKTDGLSDTQLAEIDNTAVTALNINNDRQDFLGQILSGEKTIETRATPIKVGGRELAAGDRVGLVSTGRRDRGMLKGYATIKAIHHYTADNFQDDYDKHLVAPGSEYDIKPGKTKIGYEFENVTPLTEWIPTSNDARYPTATRDIRASLRTEDTFNYAEAVRNEAQRQELVKTLQDEVKALQKRNAELKQQFQRRPLNEKDFAKRIAETVRYYEGTVKAKTISDSLLKVAKDFYKDPQAQYSNLEAAAIDAASRIVQSALRENEFNEPLQVKRHLHGLAFSVPQSTKNDFGDWNDIRKAYFGRLRISDGAGYTVSEVYDDLGKTFGKGLFPDDIVNPTDQLEQIMSIVDDADKAFENPWDGNTANIIRDVSYALISDVMDAEHLTTYADRQAEKRNEIKKQSQERVARVRAESAETRRKLVEKMQKQTQERMDRLRAEKNQRYEDLKQYYRDQAERRRQRKYESEDRQKLLRLVRRLETKKTTQANRAWIESIIGDIDSVAMSMTGAKFEELSKLRDWYYKAMESDPDFVRDTNIEAKIERLEKRRIKDMSIEDVRDLIDVLRSVDAQITYARKLIDDEDRRDTYLLAQQVITDIQSSTGVMDGAIGAFDKAIIQGSLSPERAVHRYTGYVENDPLYRATKKLSEGQRNMLDYQYRANQRFIKWTADRQFMRDITGSKAKTTTYKFKNIDGSTVELEITPAMRMSLYLHAKNAQNLKHIVEGGLTIPGMKSYKKDNLSTAYNKEGTTVRLTASQIRQITNDMTEKERAFAGAVYNYFNGMSQTEINRVSEMLKGYSLAQVEAYFPINTDSNFLRKDYGKILNDGTVEGMGFLKERIEFANNPVLLRDITAVLTESINQTSKYVGLAIPVSNMNKLLKAQSGTWNQKTGKWQVETSVQKELAKKWDTKGADYLSKMLTDIQNPADKMPDLDKAFSKIRSNYAGAVLTLNLSVAMKQAASYPTAAAVVGWAPLAKAMTQFGKVDLDLVNKYTPLQWYRTQGYSTQELGDIRSQNKLMANLPKALNWIQAVDLATTRKLWKAAEIYIQDSTDLYDKSKGAKGQSEDYYRAVADIYNQIIEETQPNYTTMQRPELLRSNSAFTQAITMFKTQPFQNFNITFDAIANFQAKRKAYLNATEENRAQALTEFTTAKKRLGNMITSQVAQLFTFAAMTLLWNVLRGNLKKYKKKDEDELTALSVALGVGKDMASSLFSELPFGAEAWEFIASKAFGDKYYGFDSVSISALNDIVDSLSKGGDAVGKLISGDSTLDEFRQSMDSVLKAVSKGFGVPYENIVNLFNIGFSGASNAISEWMHGSSISGEYTYLRLTKNPKKDQTSYYNILYKAYDSGDMDMYQKIYDDLSKIDEYATTTMTAAQHLDKKMGDHYKETHNLSVNPYKYEGVTYEDVEKFDAALKKYDEPNKNNEYGTYGVGEIYNALMSMSLSEDIKSILWENTANSDKTWAEYKEYKARKKK